MTLSLSFTILVAPKSVAQAVAAVVQSTVIPSDDEGVSEEGTARPGW